MTPEDPFVEQEASFQPPCTAEVCKNKCKVIIHEIKVSFFCIYIIQFQIGNYLSFDKKPFGYKVSDQVDHNV